MGGTTCFNQYTLEGPGCASTFYPNGPKVGRDEVHLFESLLETYINIDSSQQQDPSHRYILFVLTEDDNSENQGNEALELLTQVALSYDPNQIRIYSILYYGDDGGLTFDTLQSLAAITNGQFSTATAENLMDVLTEFTYYW